MIFYNRYLSTLCTLALFYSACLFSAYAFSAIRVLSPLNSIPSSSKFEVSVATSRDGSYKKSHVHFTKEGWEGEDDDWGYSRYVDGYNMSYVNFEFSDAAVWVKVGMPNKDIPDVAVRPSKKGAQVFYEEENGRRIAKIKLQAPTSAYLKAQYLSVVPVVNGEHDLSTALGIFANPYVNPPSNNVVNVNAGNSPPKASNLVAGQTVVFKPGTHNIGLEYGLKNGVDYYFSNGAYIKGTFAKKASYSNVKIYGYGIITGKHLKRYNGDTKLKQNPLFFVDSENIIVEGLTFEDPSHHSVIVSNRNMNGNGENGKDNYIQNIKVISWRANGDGVHISGSGFVRDSFLRTNDDSAYIASEMNGVEMHRLVTWNDWNGSAFIFSYEGLGNDVILKNSDVIYSRSRFSRDDPGADTNNGWEDFDGGAVFNLRSINANKVIEDIHVENVRVEDEQMDRELFKLQIAAYESNASSSVPNSSTRFRNITFKNINAVYGGDYANKITGWSNAVYPENITFDCVKIAGKELTNLNGWKLKNIKTNEIKFKACENDSGGSSGDDSADEWWRLENVGTQGWVRGLDCDDRNDKTVPLRQVAKDYEGYCTMFQFIQAGNGYHYIKNRSTDGILMPSNCDSSNGGNSIVLAHPSNYGNCVQWKLNKDDEIRYRLQNRQTGTYMRPQDCEKDQDESLDIETSMGTGDCTLWRMRSID